MLAITDLVDGADLDVQETDQGLILVRGTRVVHVKNLSQGNTAATALNGAVDFVAAMYPRGTSYSPEYPQGIVLRHQGDGITGEIARVRILYDTPTFNRQGTPWTLSDETNAVRGSTTVSPKDWTPLSVTFTDPNDASHNIGPDIVEMELDETRRVVVLQAYVRNLDLPPLRAAVRKVNSAPFMGLGVGYWKFNRFRSVTPLYNASGVYTYMVTIELESKVDLSWAQLGILRDTQTGRYVQIRANVMLGIRQKAVNGYKYGVIQTVNGAILVGNYDVVDFVALFGLGASGT